MHAQEALGHMGGDDGHREGGSLVVVYDNRGKGRCSRGGRAAVVRGAGRDACGAVRIPCRFEIRVGAFTRVKVHAVCSEESHKVVDKELKVLPRVGEEIEVIKVANDQNVEGAPGRVRWCQ